MNSWPCPPLVRVLRAQAGRLCLQLLQVSRDIVGGLKLGCHNSLMVRFTYPHEMGIVPSTYAGVIPKRLGLRGFPGFHGATVRSTC